MTDIVQSNSSEEDDEDYSDHENEDNGRLVADSEMLRSSYESILIIKP